MRARIVATYLTVAALWGSTWMAIRIGLDDLPPLLFAGVRMGIAALVLAPLALRGGQWREVVGPARAQLALVAVLQIALPYGLMFVAQQWVPSGLAAVLFASFPVWIALLARAMVPGESLTPARVASALLGVAGVAVLQLPHLGDLEASGRLALGGALVVLSSMIVALANVLVRRHLAAVSPLAMTAGQTALGSALLLAAAALLEAGRPAAFTPTALAALGWLAVFGTALTYVGLYWLVPRVPMAAIGALPLLDTTVAVTLGALVLHEPVGWNLALGGGMVLAAAALTLPLPRRR